MEGTREGGASKGTGCAEDGSTKHPHWAQLDQKFAAKLKFSHFLDEVTSSVLQPTSLQMFRQPIGPLAKRDIGLYTHATAATAAWTAAMQTEDMAGAPFQASPNPCWPMTQQQQEQQGTLTTEEMQGQKVLTEHVGKSYLETNMDMDSIRRQDELSDHLAKLEMSCRPARMPGEDKVMQAPLGLGKGGGLKAQTVAPPVVPWGSGLWRSPCRSVSLPRGINRVSHGSIPSSNAQNKYK